jgi:peptidyl-prolyl cis-trans isomerase SurA
MKFGFGLLFSVLVCLTAAAQAPPKKVDQIVARVNEDIILKSDMDRELDIRRVQYRDQGLDPARIEQEIANEDSKTVLRDLIDRALLLQVARELDFNADLELLKTMEELRVQQKVTTIEELEKRIVEQFGDVDEFKNDIRTRYLTQRVIDSQVYGRIVITNEEMKSYYDANAKEFDRPAGVRLSEIVILVDRRLPDQVATQKKKAEEALAAIKKGESFEDIAEKYSEVETALKGGDLGFRPRTELNEETIKLVDSLAKNQTTDIIEYANELVIYKVTDKHDGGILPFELAQEFIWRIKMGEQAPDKVREFLTRLRETGFVDVKEGFTDVSAPAKKQTGEAAAATP